MRTVRIVDRIGFAALAAALAAGPASGAGKGAEVLDGETWNAGVEYYRAGDATNALRTLRPLMLSKTHGARAAELVAKIAYDSAKDPAATDPLPALEEAAAAAQIALRKNPSGERENRNFTRATDGLAALREAKRVNDVLKAAQGQDPGALLGAAVGEVRQLLDAAGTYRTNRAEKAVAEADRLSARAAKLADAWIPVREAIAAAVTNEQQAATIGAQLDQASAKTVRAAAELGDLADGAYATLADAEHDFTRFHKLLVLPPAAMESDLLAQTNAWADVAPVNGRDWQREALDYTRAFRSKFPAWARAYEQQAQADTNKPPFTAETQAKVSALATELEKLQIACVETALPPEQEKALGIIREILALLPKDGSGGGAGQDGRPQAKDPKSDEQDKKESERNREEGRSPEDEPQLDPSEEPEPEAEDADAGEDEESPEEKELEAVLKKAQERSDEHEAEKKARARRFPLPPNERDW